jgi:shikimate dehydrogenase
MVGVIGDPVEHSLSPLLHNTAFAALGIPWWSQAVRVPVGQAAPVLQSARQQGVRGCSVTMPHKEAVAALVDHRTAVADRLDAVNCVTFGDDGTVGDNTDGAGLVASLRRGDRFDPSGARCLVLGAGGAARAVIAGLADAGAAEVVVVNRSSARAERAAALAGPRGRVGEPAEVTGCGLVVNATSVGMAGTADRGPRYPLDPDLLVAGQVVVDLIYHPPVTPWLAAARDRGATVTNGVGMLVHQAALQLTLWTGREAPVEAMWAAVEDGTTAG